MTRLLNDDELVERVLAHIAAGTTDTGDEVWREPVGNYRSVGRLETEVRHVLRRVPTPFCPSAALPGRGSFIARNAAGTPTVVVRGRDGRVRAFHNVCRHRGMRIASGSGTKPSVECGYHGWTYGLDGSLLHVPHERGFPGLDKTCNGLVAMPAVERAGLVFVVQDGDMAPGTLSDIPELIGPDQALYAEHTRTVDANWKLLLEGFIEGYHIRATHPQSFLPYGFDNLNVVETFGKNSRVTYPFQRIERLADVPPRDRRVMGFVTFVYHLFPNVLVTMLSSHTNLVILEPIAVDRTQLITYTLTNKGGSDPVAVAAAKKDASFVGVTGAAEDREVVCAIQCGLASGANSAFTFGHFESAIVHFHRELAAAIAA